jgi:hypothetical protein
LDCAERAVVDHNDLSGISVMRVSLKEKYGCRVKDLTDLLLSGLQTVLKLALIVVGLIRLQVARSFARLIALSCCFFAQSLPLSYQIAPC